MPESDDRIDLLNPATVFVNRLPDMAGIVERLYRHFRTLLFQDFRHTLQSVTGRFAIVSHDEYLGPREGYNLYAVVNLPPVKGLSLVVLDGTLLAALVDDLFGATVPSSGHAATQISLMETRIGRRLVEMLLASVEAAFAQYFPLRPQVLRTEGFAALASVADALEPFCVMEADLRLPTGGGKVSVALPYRGLEPYREVLGAPIGGQVQKEEQSLWIDRAAAAIELVPVEIGFEIGTIASTAGAIAALQTGDILPLSLHGTARAVAGETTLGPVTYGEVEGNYGVYFGHDQQDPKS